MSETSGTRILNPSFLHGWNFLSMISSDEDDALPVQALACKSGPSIIINTAHVSSHDLEIPFMAMTWVPLALQSLITFAIQEAYSSEDYVGEYNSDNWEAFRSEIEKNSDMDWEDIVDLIDDQGIEFAVDFAVSSMFIESGLHEKLKSRMNGGTKLQLTA